MTARIFDDEFIRRLSRAEDYRRFLRMILDARDGAGGRGASAQLSRTAGFSRSYVSEILGGKKGLSRDTVARLKSALKLNRDLARFFDVLVALEHPAVQLKPREPQVLRDELAELRGRLGRHSSAHRQIAEHQVRTPEVFQVYAALGTEAGGADLPDIVTRTQLTERDAVKSLNFLIGSGAAVARDGRFFAVASRADALRISDAAAVSDMVARVCSSLQKNRERIVEDQSNLNVYSAFSVRRERVADLKKRLETALFDVLDEFQDDGGDCVEQVFVSLFNKPL